jgi:GNAT superfamily N-acetyltransferase
MTAPAIRRLQNEAEVAAFFPVLRQLRPHIASAAEWVERWRRQAQDGYRLAGISDGDRLAGISDGDRLVGIDDGDRLVGIDDGDRLVGVAEDMRPLALAGYRTCENLVHGRFLYVDDLVIDEAARSGGHGARLMAWLKTEGQALGCARLVLDTPLANVLGHRFYYRQGLLGAALRFSAALG